MSTNENLTQTNENSSEQAVTIQPSGITTYAGSGDWMSAGGNDSAQDTLGALALLHAVRRHWLVILSTGLCCAAVVFFALLMFLKPKYQAEATLALALSNPTVLGKPTADQTQQVQNEFEFFRDTQRSLVKNRYVIMAALRDSKLKKLECIQQEDDRHNAIAWLTNEIRVDFPEKNAGIMVVSATEPDPKDAATIVNAVVNAYLVEVVDKDQEKRRYRLDELMKISAEKENDVRSKREQLKRELENINVPDDQSAATKIQLAATMYAEFQREYQGMRAQHRALLGKLQVAQESLKDLKDIEIPETEVVMLLNNNPMYRDLQGRLALLEGIDRIHMYSAAPGTKEPAAYGRTKADLEATRAQLQKLKQDSSDMVRDAKRIALTQEIQRLKSEGEIAEQQLRAFEKEVEKKGQEADSVGKSSIAIQMQRADIENIERLLHGAAEERERLRVELRSRNRVEVLGDPNAPAAVPENETGARLRWTFVLAGSLLAMLMPAVGIAVWDLRKERINSAHDVSKRLNIPVMGAVPLIPAKVMRRLGDSTKRSQIWKMRFTESVDGVAARLLRKAECDQTRVVLVTSAMSGEGKTTLATQLAMSLARSQRKTVLVDFDLRQPTLDGALRLPLGPGICEALRGEGNVMDTVQQTETEGLSVITAGAWNRQVLAALGNGSVGTVLEALRMNFDFVIIDSSPLLPIVDTRLVCQHVDAVVLSVFRDVSQGSKVLAAQEMLDAFGVRSVEAVVTGGEEHSSVKDMAYQAAIFDKQVAEAEIVADPHENANSTGAKPQ
ncbi:MAG: polysaccharide biosynthesis tyrosine autokinase [Thermoguttaceae bacterium]